MKKKKVLIVTNPLNVGGFDVVATNLQFNMDSTKFDFVYCLRGSKVGILEPEVIKSGAKVIHQPENTLNYFKSFFYLLKLMKKEHIDIVHSHLMFYSGIVVTAGFFAGVKKRVAHSHMTDPCIENRSRVKRIVAGIYSFFMKILLNVFATDKIACSPQAGEYLFGRKSFGKNGTILNNATYLDRFYYDERIRNKIREDMNLKNKFVVGHIGRLNYVKNHKFLVNVFSEIAKIKPNSVLLIVGDGEERENIENLCRKLGVFENVIFTGIRKDVENLLNAMDIFVFPSLHEGLPMTLVEAQATKLPCLVADTVSDYAKMNSNFEFFSLEKSAKEWAEKAVELYDENKNRIEISNEKVIENYDIKNIAKQLEKIYLN